ncbi:hypothetical protein HYY74_05165 [Candidatus Woesearchaeota archaeon]|nr:hypothetical protein [Candidatus Woesearchaeota archaeon]
MGNELGRKGVTASKSTALRCKLMMFKNEAKRSLITWIRELKRANGIDSQLSFRGDGGGR